MARGRRRRGQAGLVVPVAAVAAAVATALVAAPAASPRRAAPCRLLTGVTGFRGTANSSFSNSASGQDLGSGSTETINLSRSTNDLQVRLVRMKSRLPSPVLFAGKVTGGSFDVGDTFAVTGSDFGGQAMTSATPRGTALLAIFPPTCIYQLLVGSLTTTSFSGDADYDSHPSEGAYTPRRHLPATLKLAGGASVSAYYDGCLGALIPDEQGCYQFSGGYAVDFETLVTCGATSGGTCGPSDQEQGTAHIGWSLTPQFVKKK